MINFLDDGETEYVKFYLTPRCRSGCHTRYGLKLDFYPYLHAFGQKTGRLQSEIATTFMLKVF